MLESGTGLPDSLAARFNCSLSLTRLRKSERHFECLTKEKNFPPKIQRHNDQLLCSIRTLIRLAMIR